MDDVTSGFNIGTNISLDGRFNEVLGFTETEVRGVLEDYREAGALDQDVDGILDLMGNWYNGYRFAGNGQVDLYNTNMVLYYIKACIPNREGPHELIDRNVRINYGNLRHLLTVGQRAGGVRLNGNFELLRHVVGEGWVDSDIESGFPLDRLDQRENFLSLLHYFGLLSIREVRDGVPRLGIPNQTVKRLMYGYLRDAYEDVGVFAVDVYAFSRLDARDGVQGRVATGHGVPARRHCRPDRHPGLHRGRESPAGLLGGVSECYRLLRIPHRAGTQQGVRGHLLGTAAGPLSRHPEWLRHRTQIPQPGRWERDARRLNRT